VQNEQEASFNPSRLAFARRHRGLSKKELADKLDVTYRAVVAYELGEYPPSSDTWAALCSVLEFPEHFFRGGDLETLLAEDVSFRSLTKMSARQRDAALTQSELALYLSKWLESRFELPPVDLPDLRQEADPEAAAEALREHWGLGQLAIRNVVHLLESKGVRVFSLSIRSAEVDALSTWKAGTPFVFLNSYKSAERSRFDAGHELGHLVLHRHGTPSGREGEEEAHQFASAFLMPAASVLARAPKIAAIPELIRLKKVFGVSVAAINYRLHQLKLITDWQYRSLAVQISKSGYRTNEPDPAPRETSLVLPMVLGRLYDEGFSRGRIAHELGLPLEELESLLFSLVMASVQGGRTGEARGGTAKPKLSLVK
jgi:Zn-dependent peptidase ImmA (M78 family)/DNA-binding XRE family transcriptional regulator